jgi:hypothetical protein
MVFATGEETLQRASVDPGLAELGRCAGGGRKSFDCVPILFHALTNTLEHCGLASAGPPLETVNAVGGVERFLDDTPLRLVQKVARTPLFLRLLRTQDRRNSVAALEHEFNIGALGGNGLRRGEPAPGSILRTVYDPKITLCTPGLEL